MFILFYGFIIQCCHFFPLNCAIFGHWKFLAVGFCVPLTRLIPFCVLPYFLASQDVLGLSYLFFAPVLVSVTSPRRIVFRWQISGCYWVATVAAASLFSRSGWYTYQPSHMCIYICFHSHLSVDICLSWASHSFCSLYVPVLFSVLLLVCWCHWFFSWGHCKENNPFAYDMNFKYVLPWFFICF